jgi:hypothetical protein
MEFEAAIRAYKFALRFLIFTSPSTIHPRSPKSHCQDMDMGVYGNS